jgi:hypothetical protein
MPMRREARPVATRSVNLIHREALGNIIRIQQRADPTCGIGLGTAARVENALNDREFGQGQTAAIESTSSLGRWPQVTICCQGLFAFLFFTDSTFEQCGAWRLSYAQRLRPWSPKMIG